LARDGVHVPGAVFLSDAGFFGYYGLLGYLYVVSLGFRVGV
jgi:hypothetical protein